MKKVLVLSKNLQNTPNFVNGINSLSSQDVKYEVAELEELIILADNSGLRITLNGQDISEYSLIYPYKFPPEHKEQSDMLMTALYENGITGIQVRESQVSNKVSQMILFASKNLPVPKSLYLLSKRIEAFDFITGNLNLPFIMKDINGSQGDNNFLVKSEQDFEELLKSHTVKDFIFQEYIEHSEDYRLLVLGDKVATIRKRIKIDPNSHLANITKGAQPKSVSVDEFPSEVIKNAIIGAKAIHREVVGMDFIQDKKRNQFVLLEANKGPNFAKDLEKFDDYAKLDEFIRSKLISRN